MSLCFVLFWFILNHSKSLFALKVYCLVAPTCMELSVTTREKKSDPNQPWLAEAVVLLFHTYWHGTPRRVAPASCPASSWLLLLLRLCVQCVSVVFVVVYEPLRLSRGCCEFLQGFLVLLKGPRGGNVNESAAWQLQERKIHLGHLFNKVKAVFIRSQ